MGEFVADDHADRSKIYRIVLARIEVRGLKNARREIDGVQLRIVISVDGRRSHGPLAAVDWFADLLHPALEFVPPALLPREIPTRLPTSSDSRLIFPRLTTESLLRPEVGLAEIDLFGALAGLA